MHQSNLTAPSPRPLRGNSNFCLPRDNPRAFIMHVVSYPNITEHGGFYWKHKKIGRLAHLKICRGF